MFHYIYIYAYWNITFGWKKPVQFLPSIHLQEFRISMFQSIEDDAPFEVLRIKVALAFGGFEHPFPHYSVSNTKEG